MKNLHQVFSFHTCNQFFFQLKYLDVFIISFSVYNLCI